MKCLVTGAAGFIGGSLVNRLVKEGHEVVALIHKTKPKEFEKKIKFIEGDITDVSSIQLLFKNVDVVFHCAAYVKDYGAKKNFYKINVQGTKNLINLSKENNVKRFIFLSHIQYESSKKFGYYSKTKEIAEQILISEYKENFFPYIIIRPGNVFGPGASVWVLRNIKSIKKRRIALVNNGNGIFLHTYIDNLLDALIMVMNNKKAIGNYFNITDGDYSITFGKYLNDLAKIIGEKQITKNMSKNQALIIGKIMIFLNKIFQIEPWVTPTAVNILTNDQKISIEKARKILGYKPKIQYKEAMEKIAIWLKQEGYI